MVKVIRLCTINLSWIIYLSSCNIVEEETPSIDCKNKMTSGYDSLEFGLSHFVDITAIADSHILIVAADLCNTCPKSGYTEVVDLLNFDSLVCKVILANPSQGNVQLMKKIIRPVPIAIDSDNFLFRAHMISYRNLFLKFKNGHVIKSSTLPINE
jgi:hypothetical protein